MDIKEFLLKYKRQAVVVVILLSVIIGVSILKKIATWLPYLAETNHWSVPSWFNTYGAAVIALIVAIAIILLLNLTFRKFMKSLEEE